MINKFITVLICIGDPEHLCTTHLMIAIKFHCSYSVEPSEITDRGLSEFCPWEFTFRYRIRQSSAIQQIVEDILSVIICIIETLEGLVQLIETLSM